MTEAVIPPVTAGEIRSSIDIEYPNEHTIEARSEHSWQFDVSAYAEQTGLDLGANYPYVTQENGHTLRVVTDIRVSYSSSGRVPYAVFVERKGVRGTRSYQYYWTQSGGYDVDDEMTVDATFQDRQPYRQRESDTEIPHREVPVLDGTTFSSPQQLIYEIHYNKHGVSTHDLLGELIRMDSPDGAMSVEEATNRMSEWTTNTQSVQSD